MAQEPLRVVGIGASVGGLEAFTTFLQHMPADSGLAFVLIQHLAPHQASLLTELLATQTAMPVLSAVDAMPVLANHVYLIPPNTTITIAAGKLRLESPVETHGQRLPIDHFFRSLAAEQGERAAGIVLSGTGSDGSLGLAAIRERGGLTIAQTPASAEAPEMPRQAIAYQSATYVLDIAAMPALLLATAAPHPADVGADADALWLIIELVLQATGHDFHHYKPATLQRRIDRRIQVLRLDSRERYLTLLRQDRREIDLLLQDLLINVTAFFRDPASFEALARIVLPEMIHSGRGPLRIWVPGCASGEEVYSLAILFHEQMQRLDAPPAVQLFATDIDEDALAHARQGRYDLSIADHISPERLARYFVREEQHYQVGQAIRELCLFATHNVISDPPFGRLDLIACRNLLIYFDANLQRQIISAFHYALAPNGYLFLGAAEHATGATETSELFRVIDAPHRIYQRLTRQSRPQVDLPWARAGRVPAPAAGGPRLTPATRAGSLGAIVADVLLSDYAPAAIAINAQGMILHLQGRVQPYLTLPEGALTMSLHALIHPDLRLPLRIAIREAAKSGGAAVHADLAISVAAEPQQITLTVRPLADPGGQAGFLLVIIQAVALPADRGPPAGPPPPAADDRLARELRRTRDTLEAAIDELREANLDLTAANEELRSLNEEHQATNEELQTSKEEIQSINEELQTVNAELNRKIEELDRTNADLANLFASAQIPAIYLHTDGRIARFTAQATDLFALIASDIGRPITDLRPHFHAEELLPRIAQILRDFAPADLVVHQPAGDRWWSVRLRPYRTLANTIDGVVITFADISAIKRAEVVLQESHDALEQRVAQRTRELTAANAALRAEVQERERGDRARQELIRQLLSAQEEERRRIARELHDQMGQDLTALMFGLKALHDNMAADTGNAERIKQLQQMAIQIGQEVRTLAVQLRPSTLDDLGLREALSTYIEQWSTRAQVAADLHTSGLDGERLPLTVETTVYRLVQEALTNVLRHAQASEVSVIIERRPARLRLIVEDDGVGFTVPSPTQHTGASPHLGLLGMRERVALLNGTLTIESAPGSGTTIFAYIPLAAAPPGGDDGDNDNLSG